MLTDCPDPKEVADFHFLQLRTLRIAKENESVPAKSANILTAASKYGLLFVGIEEGFKVIKLEAVLTLDEDKENRSFEENYSYDFVPSGTPILLSVNANQTILAVCVKGALDVIINLYSFSTYPSSGSVWQPFCVNALSSPGAELRDFVWNPAVEGLYAVCFSDGSVHIHEVAETSIKSIGVLQTANAVSVCWSPKGKQLVAGKDNGSFTQYKPNLQEVRTVPPPALEETPISVRSICWISNTVFAVVYIVGDTPNLFIVSTPKDSAVVYTNFYDVCLGNNCAPYQKYLLHLEPSWGILVCASLDSIEIAVLGDMPNWVQWDLKEDGKALLPGKDGATHAIGMTVIYSAQTHIVISESESYPPMPVMFLLTNNGLLVSFYMINSNAGAASLVSPPLQLEHEKITQNGEPAMDATQVMLKQTLSTANQPLMSSYAVGNKPVGDQSPVSQNREAQKINIIPTFRRIENLSTPSHAGGLQESSSLFGNEVHMNGMKKPDTAAFSQVLKSLDKNQMGLGPLLSAAEKQNEVQSSTQNSYMTAIISEIQSFAKELQDLKHLQSCASTIDGEEDMVSLKTFAFNLQNFQKDIFETMQSVSSDIYTLKNVLLEGFVLVEEACSRERRRNDHSYISMLKERALDPITAKRMQKMNQHYQYLSTQMQEVGDKLDRDWINILSNKKKSFKSNPCVSSTEAIYKTIVNNQKIIHNLRKKVEILLKKTEDKKLRNTTRSGSWGRYHKRSMQEDLSKLADEFLQVKIAYPEEESNVTKKLSSKSQTVLKTFLKQISVVTVRPTSVYSPSQSRLLSNAAPSEDQGDEKDFSPKQIITSTTEEVILSAKEAITSPNVSSKLSFENAAKPYVPVYEPITPPEVVSAPVNKSFTASNVLGTSIMKDNFFENHIYHQSLPTVASTMDSSVKEKDQYQVKTNVEGPPNISCPVGTKSVVFNHTSSESVTSASTSLVFPKTLSFTSSTPQVAECATSKPVTVNSNTTVTTAVPSFQFTSSFGQRKETSRFTPPVVHSTASPVSIQLNPHAELKISVTSESSQFSQPEVSLTPLSSNTLNLPSSQSTSFTLPVNKTSLTTSPCLFRMPENKNSGPFSLSENKNSVPISLLGNKAHSDMTQAKSDAGFFFHKPSNNVNQPNASALKKDTILENAISSPLTSTDDIPSLALNLVNKTVSVDLKSSDSQVFNSQLTDGEKSDTTQSANSAFSSNQIYTIQKTEDYVSASSKPDTFSHFSDLKEALSSSDLTTSKPSIISSTVTSVPVSEKVVSNVLQLRGSASVTASSSTPSDTCTVSIISQSEPHVSKPSTPPMPALLPETTTSTPPATFFSHDATVSSPVSPEVVNSDVAACKTDSSATSVFDRKSTPLFGQPPAETSSFFNTVNAEAPTFGQQSVIQAPPFGQTASNSNFPAASGGFFSQTPSFGAAASPTTTSASDFNSQTSTFSFGKPAFGQTTGSFGLAKSFFGQNTTSFTQAGSSSSFSFGQNSNSVFGQGSFFSGLGGKPSEENASKNVFGIGNSVKPNTDTNLFRNSSVTSFGAVNSGSISGTGSFSSGSGSVAQAGFGSFQQNTSQQPGTVLWSASNTKIPVNFLAFKYCTSS